MYSHFTPSPSMIPFHVSLHFQVRVRDINRSFIQFIHMKSYPFLSLLCNSNMLKSLAQVLATQSLLFVVDFDRLQQGLTAENEHQN